MKYLITIKQLKQFIPIGCRASIFALLPMFMFLSINSTAQICLFGTCDGYTTYVDVDNVPDCDSIGQTYQGDIDNGSTCNNPNVPPGTVANCYTWIFQRTSGSPITGIFGDIGQGAGCTGEIDDIFSLIGGVCTGYGSSGSQNIYDFQFGNSDEIQVWLCNGSSGQVSICDLCAFAPPLPVEIASFEVTKNSNSAELVWETLSEVDNFGFYIQKSYDGIQWDVLGFCDGIGTSNEVNEYRYVDEDLSCERQFYRLKQVDLDGSSSFSEVRDLFVECEFSLEEAIEKGTFYNQQGQLITEKRGLVFVRYKGKTHKVFFPY